MTEKPTTNFLGIPSSIKTEIPVTPPFKLPDAPQNIPQFWDRVTMAILKNHTEQLIATGSLNLDDLWQKSSNTTVVKYRAYCNDAQGNLLPQYKTPFCGRKGFIILPAVDQNGLVSFGQIKKIRRNRINRLPFIRK